MGGDTVAGIRRFRHHRWLRHPWHHQWILCQQRHKQVQGGTADQNGVIQVTAIQLNANANLNVGSGGEVLGGFGTNGAIGINSRSSGTIRITGGTITGGPADRSSGAALSLGGTGPVFISGGDLMGGASGLGLENYGSGQVWITGGRFSTSSGAGGTSIFTTRFFNTTTNQAELGGVVTILGGQIESSVSGLRWGLGANPLGTIALFSQNDTPFLVNGVPMNHTSIPLMPGTNTISGTLYNGDVLDTTFYNDFSGTGVGGSILLNVGTVPEPSTMLILAFGVVALQRRRPGRR
ncbi:PEP-CTERM sorting domain-containing protein [Humisphaera borealis]|uniref:PEP-CTERM sorting domain-containing protein n=1 Tax=Humisphaera borealis TaxID=2807512 RepID=A0A7M2X538_9BACT|nr:PEP-CTERM sorting domain-containing protein [Humisphaera borealis]QOV91910.1 PEP-CTERM sorting domain-containing protein [Humisphaera borealis]